jgi:hypothetical protein
MQAYEVLITTGIIMLLTLPLISWFLRKGMPPDVVIEHKNGTRYTLEFNTMGSFRGTGVERTRMGRNDLVMTRIAHGFHVERYCHDKHLFLEQGFSEEYWPEYKGISLGVYTLLLLEQGVEVYFAPYRYAFQEGKVSKKQILEKHPLHVIEVLDDDPDRVSRT